MNKLKKHFALILFIIILINLFLFNVYVTAASEDYLIKVGTGSYAVTVTNDTTVDEIKNILGEPKLTTISAHGGNAYAFYTDDNYSNYLYIETRADGKIVSYGSVDPSYQTSTLTYNEENPYIFGGGPYLYGSLASDSSDNYKIKGGVYFNKKIINTQSYLNAIKENPELYLKELSKQSIVMYNAFSTHLGNKTYFKFDEKLFDIQTEYKKRGYTVSSMLMETFLSKKGLAVSENRNMSDSVSVINPMYFAYYAIKNTNGDYTGYNNALFDYDIDTKLLQSLVIDDEALEYFHNGNVTDAQIIDEDVKLVKNTTDILSLIREDMSDVEKLSAINSYLHNGTVYNLKGKKGHEYIGPIVYHEGVCDGFSKAFRMLANYIGIYSDRVISRKQNHAWNITLIDGEWTYIDPQKNVRYLVGSARAEACRLWGFWSKSEAMDLSYTFSDAFLENDPYATLPEGVEIKPDTASSKIYYDEEYKYYLYKNLSASNDVNGLYKENRKTGERTCITTSPMIFYDTMSCEIIKDGNIIYFVGQDVKSIYSIKTDGTDEKLVYSTKVDGEYIGGVYSSDGYLCYSTFYPDQASNIRTTEKENILFKLQDTSSDYKIYTLDNDKQKYRLVYTKNKDGITIIKCIGMGNYFPEGELYIPETIEGLPVIGIGKSAFFSYEGLTGTIVIPDTVKYIGDTAFSFCENITSLKLGKGLIGIGDSAFSFCEGLTDNVIEVPEGVKAIGPDAFKSCKNIKSVIFPSTLDVIAPGTLDYCDSLEDVLIKNENMIEMYLPDDVDIYLPASTCTSDLADSKGISYKDSKTTKPTITLSDEELELYEGNTYELSYTLLPYYYYAFPTSFKSSNSSVAKVDSLGKITAVSKGTATISFTVDGITKTCSVNVKKESQFKEMTKTFEPVDPNTPFLNFETKAELKTGEKVSVIWTSNNTKVATTQRGTITPVSGGFATVTAEDETYGEAKVLVYVSYPIILSDGKEAYAGDLNNDYVMDEKDVAVLEDIVTNNKVNNDYLKIADINGDSIVDDKDVSLLNYIVENDLFEVVKEKVVEIESIVLMSMKSSIKVGESNPIYISFKPSDYTVPEPDVTWTSSNSSIATVDEYGVVKGISGGSVTITARTQDGIEGTYNLEIISDEIIYTTLEVNEDVVGDIIVFSPKTVISDKLTKENFPVLDKNYTIEICMSSLDDTVKDTSSNFGTKNIIKIKDALGNVKKTYIAIVKGDINGDGKLMMYDAFQILKGTIVGNTLEKIDIFVQDYNNDGKVMMYDAFQFLKQAILG